jgi:hypothetical protein
VKIIARIILALIFIWIVGPVFLIVIAIIWGLIRLAGFGTDEHTHDDYY